MHIQSIFYTLHSTCTAVSPEGGVTITPDDALYSELDNVTFTCTSHGGPENHFQWFKNNVPISELENNFSNTSTLYLHRVTARTDGAVYTCVVTNSAGSGDASVSLNIRPRLVQSPTNLLTKKGATAVFVCLASAYPEPTYQWMRIGGVLPVSAVGENTTTLSILPVQFEDEGYYYCSVTSNEITLSTLSVYLLSESSYKQYSSVTI